MWDHGTLTGYINHRCRCAACKSAKASYKTEYAARNLDKASYAAYYAENAEQESARKAKWREANQDKLAAYEVSYRERRYGLEPGRIAQMMADQDGRCAICQSEFGDATPHVDHDHNCCPPKRSCGQCVRGLLCQQCNHALGSFKDDPTRLRNALLYLEAHAEAAILPRHPATKDLNGLRA